MRISFLLPISVHIPFLYCTKIAAHRLVLNTQRFYFFITSKTARITLPWICNFFRLTVCFFRMLHFSLLKFSFQLHDYLSHDLSIHICCLIQQKYLPVLHLRYNILQNVKNRYTDLRSCSHYTQYSYKILFMFSIFIGFAK